MNTNRQKIYTLAIVLLVLISTAASGFAKNPLGGILPEIVQTGDEKFDKTFREGRDLIDKEDWKQAAEKFKSIVCDCPEKKYVDAAFYWLAFAYKKQKMYTEMNAALNRLQTNFPNSSWVDDARVMRMEQNVYVATAPGFNKIYVTGQAFGIVSDTVPLDREEEVKLAAFRSLLSTDAARAIQLSDDLLKTNSKASENLKIQIVRLVSSQRPYRISFPALQPMGVTTLPSMNTTATSKIYTTTSDAPAQITAVGTATGQSTVTLDASPDNSATITKLTPQIREVLVKNYKSGASVNLQKEIIYALGRLNDIESINYLSDLYNSESNKELKKAVLQSFGGSSFYSSSVSSKSLDVRRAAFDKLLDIVKTEQDIELKTAALSSLQNTSFWSKNNTQNESVKVFSQIYDSSNDDNFKESIIRSLARYQQQDDAVKKLMDIAKNEKSDKLRIAAINALQGSKNPEVVKFLEDLIK